MHNHPQDPAMRSLRIVIADRDFQSLKLNASAFRLIGKALADSFEAVQADDMYTIKCHDHFDDVTAMQILAKTQTARLKKSSQPVSQNFKDFTANFRLKIIILHTDRERDARLDALRC